MKGLGKFAKDLLGLREITPPVPLSKAKAYCRDCKWLKENACLDGQYTIWDCGVVLGKGDWYSPDGSQEPKDKNANNNCPDFERKS